MLDSDASHRNLFNQLIVKRIDRIESMHLSASDLVSRRIANRKKRVKLPERLQGFRRPLRLALDLLRFIDDENRTVCRYNIDRPTRLKVVKDLIYAAGVFASGVERLAVDNHHLHTRVG